MAAGEEQTSCFFNVGGCYFSIPLNRLSCFQESLLLKEHDSSDEKSRWFIDRDGCTFRHVNYYMHTGKLAPSCASEINILYELAAGLRLTALQQALENLQSGKHFLRARPVDVQVTERAALTYWKTRICNTRQPEPMASPVSTVHGAVPLALVGTPLVDSDEEVLYCFLPLEQVRLHPGLVAHGNLLWLCHDVAIIECGSRLFRFIANFLQTGKILLPEQFSDYERLNSEAKMVGMTEFIEALQELSDMSGDCASVSRVPSPKAQLESTAQPLYVMTFDLLVRYPDSSLGQLWVDGDLDGSRLHITGTGVLFEHVEYWLGTSRLPLTESGAELRGLCEYLDGQGGVYLVIKEAFWEFLHRKRTRGRDFTAWPWSASVATFTIYKVVKVYVGTHWYATYFKTLLKHPELLSNSSKVRWISFGVSLHVTGDGQMFRHILNFLRCGRLMLPTTFREWPLLCQEIEAFQIPALSGALQDSSDYRAWCKANEPASDGYSSSSSSSSLLIYDEDRFLGITVDDEEEMEQQPFLRDSPADMLLSVSGSETRRDRTASELAAPRGSLMEKPRGSSALSASPDGLPQRASRNSTSQQRREQASTLSTPLERLARLVEDAVRRGTRAEVFGSQPAPSGRERTTAGLQEHTLARLSALTALLLQQRPSAGQRSTSQQEHTHGTARPHGTKPSSSTARPHGTKPSSSTARPHGTKPSSSTARPHGTKPSSSTARPHGTKPSSSTARPHGTKPSSSTARPHGTKPSSSTARPHGTKPSSSTAKPHGTKPSSSTARPHGTKPSSSTAKPHGTKPSSSTTTTGGGERPCVLPVRGCVLRVDHPPVLGRGEPGGYFTQSVIYTSSLPHTAHRPHAAPTSRKDPKNVAFVYFNLSYEEMACGRECHRFLCGTILDSRRLDSNTCSLKTANLVYSLWTGQAEVEDVVSELMRVVCVKRPTQDSERLLQWLKVTLPLAQRYAACMELLGKDQCRTETLFPEDNTAAPDQGRPLPAPLHYHSQTDLGAGEKTPALQTLLALPDRRLTLDQA